MLPYTVPWYKRLADPALTYSQNARSRSIPCPTAVVILLSLPCVLYAGLFPLLRGIGEPPLLIALALAVVAILLQGTIIGLRDYWLFLIFSTLILALSFLSAMPKGWTLMHDNFAAVRHWIWIPALPIIGSAFMFICRRSFKHVERHAVKYLLVIYVATRLSRAFSGDIYTEEQAWSIYTFTSDNMIVALAFLVFLFRSRRNMLIDCVLIVLMLAISTSAQSDLFFLWLFMLRVLQNSKLLILALAVGTTAFILIAPLYIEAVDGIDPNSGVRAVLWRDAWVALFQTYGIGVGFGTEYITNNFSEIRGPHDWSMVGSESDLIYVATHSTYYDVALRTGVVGLSLFLIWFRSALRLDVQLDQRREQLHTAVVGLLLINCSVNVGLSSIQFLFGTSFCLYLLAYIRESFGRRIGSRRLAVKARASFMNTESV